MIVFDAAAAVVAFIDTVIRWATVLGCTLGFVLVVVCLAGGPLITPYARRPHRPTQDDAAFLARERHRYDQVVADLDLPRAPRGRD
ncbi:hypothetical protein CF54_04120 [Streptomyces sp. Tu 6176]|uniref:hypothetical protein n=1 Tax=Streptomyces sp. Tu 6176 TaxID=1470557 RepID=UPI0004486FB2|nr:hypothetical protein [Streptomyces sp. Tu 6176]EYT83999.1 hypothetical protein CF54_04120 [Streptomyces sp. Tu 6176]